MDNEKNRQNGKPGDPCRERQAEDAKQEENGGGAAARNRNIFLPGDSAEENAVNADERKNCDEVQAELLHAGFLFKKSAA